MGEGGRRPGEGSVADRDALLGALTLLAIISDEKSLTTGLVRCQGERAGEGNALVTGGEETADESAFFNSSWVCPLRGKAHSERRRSCRKALAVASKTESLNGPP
jgi:hypothetical protein